MSDNIRMEKKIGYRCTSSVQWARQFAWVFDYMHWFGVRMAVCKRGNSGARNFRPETRWYWGFELGEKIENTAIGPYSCSYLTSLGASCLFFLFSYSVAFSNQPVIIFLVVAISYYLLWELAYLKTAGTKINCWEYWVVRVPKMQ